jgi:low affinity Fe/Cu permease
MLWSYSTWFSTIAQKITAILCAVAVWAACGPILAFILRR